MAKIDWTKLQFVIEYTPIDPNNPESVEIRAAQFKDTAELLLEIHQIKSSKKKKRPAPRDEDSEVAL